LTPASCAQVRDRVELGRLGAEQAALRRVAGLAARGAAPGEVFEAVSAEAGRLISADAAGLSRYEDGGMMASLGSWSETGRDFPVGTRFGLERGTVAWLVFEATPSTPQSRPSTMIGAPTDERQPAARAAAGAEPGTPA
jgi:hypothetical protein